MLDLATRLSIPRYAAVGILECLWHWAARYARRGDVGRFTDEQVALGTGWTGDAAKLIKALLDSRWLDLCNCHRLRIHNWPKHADQTVRSSREVSLSGFLECYLAEPTSDVGATQDGPSAITPLPTPTPEPLPTPGAARAAASVGVPQFEWERKNPIPKGLNVPAFRSALRDWFAYRSERRLCVWKLSTIKVKLAEFEAIGVERSVAAIRYSIGNCWQGIYEPRTQLVGGGKSRFTLPDFGQSTKTSSPSDPDVPALNLAIALEALAAVTELRNGKTRAEVEAAFRQAPDAVALAKLWREATGRSEYA